MAENIHKVIQERDDLTKVEATCEVNRIGSQFDDMIAEGASYTDIEEMMLDEGLEMDYIMDFF